jgi:hypothetical protein
MVRRVSRSRRRISETENPVVLCADEGVEVREDFPAASFTVDEDSKPDTFGQPRVPSSAELFPGHVCSVDESNPECLGP